VILNKEADRALMHQPPICWQLQSWLSRPMNCPKWKLFIAQ